MKKLRGGKKENKKARDMIQTCIAYTRAESELKIRR